MPSPLKSPIPVHTVATAGPLVAISSCAFELSQQESQVYRGGMTGSEVRATLTQKPGPDVAAVRPPEGWQSVERDEYRVGILHPQIGAEASAFEQSTSQRVDSCEVHIWPRGILGMGGFDLHYLFYGAADRLVGFSRRLAID